MSEQKVVSVGGVDYDSHTGLPLQQAEVHSPIGRDIHRTQSVHAQGIHKTQQRSAALNRQFVKKSPQKAVQSARPTGRSMDVRPTTNRSPHISKFAKELHAAPATRVVSDIAPVVHPSVVKAHAVSSVAKLQTTHKEAPSARDIKHAELGRALLNAQPNTTTVKAKKPRRRALNIVAATLGLLLVAGYFTYVNLPNLSVRVAAAQAGIDATFPEYRPVGYHLDGPVGYQQGEVSMNFASNSGPLEFSLSQSRSTWDSSALLEKYVNPHSSGKYATYNDAGLTIYTYGNDAAWINGGILYTVDGTATLSNEQIRRIATSM